MMRNYDHTAEINHNSNWPYIPDHPFMILVIGGPGLDKNNVLPNLKKTWITRYWQNLFIRKISTGIKELIGYQRKN